MCINDEKKKKDGQLATCEKTKPVRCKGAIRAITQRGSSGKKSLHMNTSQELGERRESQGGIEIKKTKGPVIHTVTWMEREDQVGSPGG